MPYRWMRKRVVGFTDLPLPARTEITGFFWLWSFFEGTHLGEEANRDSIRALARRWSDGGLLDRFPFGRELAYFQDRYFPDGQKGPRYEELNWDRNRRDEPDVRRVLSGRPSTEELQAVALLFVIFRLRNNLVHGPKWRGNLANQRDNFRHANSFIKTALELDGRGLLAV